MERFALSNIEFEGCKKAGNMFYTGDWLIKDAHYFFFRSSLYEDDITPEDALERFAINPIDFISERKGDFLVVDYNVENDTLMFCTDRLGKDYFYYCVDDSRTILASDVWVAASILKPKEEDINWQAVKNLVIMNNMLIRHSYIIGLEMIPPATLFSYDRKNGKLTSEKYWELKYSENKDMTIDDTVEKLDHIFDNTFENLSRKYPSNTKYGVGLSGGWDTRIIVHYAKKHNLHIVPYCIGQKRLLFFFPTYGFHVAKKIANYFKLDNFVFIDYNSEKIDKKFIREIRMLPERASNMEIGCLSKVPDFDVMLNGEHGGVFFGEFDWEPVLSFNKSNISDYLLGFLSFKSSYNMIFSEQEYMNLRNEIQTYINSMDTNDQFEIVYKYFYEILGSQSKRGFFETNYDTKERYTPYLDPGFFDFYLTWNSKFRMDRSLQRKFFMTKMPELSKMPDEASDAPLYWRSLKIHDVPYRFYYALLNLFFKPSLRRNVWLKHDKLFHKIYRNVVASNSDMIEKHFSNLDTDYFLKNNPRAASTFAKCIATIDAMINSDCNEIEEYIRRRYSLS